MNDNNKENAGIDLQPITYSPSAKNVIYYQLLRKALVLLTAAISSHAAVAQTAFVANMGMNDVSVIDVVQNTVIDTIPVGLRPAQVEVSPDGRRVYVSNYGSDTVSVIDVASHAVIATIAVGHGPWGIAASPDNLKVYVTHDSGADVDFVWVIDVATSTASLAFSLPNQTDAQPTATFHPTGSEIWIKNGCGDGCTRRVAYPSNVVLGDLPSETAGANADENHFSFVPGTLFLYAAHSCGCCGHFDRSQYAPSISYTGRRYEDGLGSAQWTVAAPIGGIAYLARITHCTTPSIVIRKESATSDSTLTTLTIPGFFTQVGAITPDGTRLYMTAAKPDGTSPDVTVVDTASMSVVTTIPVGSQPFGIAISPVAPGVPRPATLTLNPPAATNQVDTSHCLTATVEDASGNPVPGITVRFAVTGSVNTSGSATTDSNGQATFCYQGPPLPGIDAITAYADTNNDNSHEVDEPMGAATKIWTLPVTTPLVEVSISNGGLITSLNGDTATFGGNAKSDASRNTQGQEEYQDQGPANPLTVHSINVLAIVSDGPGNEASIYGQATIDGAGSFLYRIKVKDLGEPGVGKDTYWILLENGYNSGEQVLEGGNVQIRRN